ncbi:MAG: hypothetical protein ACYTF0_02685 [Planctomycetota bacterium]|jgi:hypothetical protein
MAGLAELIRAKLDADGVTASAAAKTVGVAYPIFKKLLDGATGKRRPQARVIDPLATWLGINADLLMKVAMGKASIPVASGADSVDKPSSSSVVSAGEPAAPASETVVASAAEAPAAVSVIDEAVKPASRTADLIDASQADLLRAAAGEIAVPAQRDGRTYYLSGLAALQAFVDGRI